MSESNIVTEHASHTATVKHNPEAHEIEDCHDDCEVTVDCPGVKDSCRAWWECETCRETERGLSDDAYLDWFDRMDTGEGDVWHGVEHQRIDGMWMTPTDRCITQEFDTDADDLVWTHPDGTYPVDIDCEEGSVYIIASPIRGDMPADADG